MSIEVPYLAIVVEHYRRPHNQRALAAPTHAHEGVNPLCGDRVRVEVEVRDGAVLDAAFAASACAIATASASLLTDRVRGSAVADALRVDEESVVAALGAGVPPARRGCAVLPLRVLRQALGQRA
ncbi:MAG TPA: iron-sulfur cluster assembly scaffold protein [Gemmatimonadaceae bacterium]|nr:iron-sulfur cluster assembly scaffold protein [Gemmatimonadaceae bacterium]